MLIKGHETRRRRYKFALATLFIGSGLFTIMLLSATQPGIVYTSLASSLPTDRAFSASNSPQTPHEGCGMWNVVSSPNSGSVFNSLSAVEVVSPNDVWAVGRYSNDNAGSQTLIEHWDGNAWSIIPSLSPGSGENFLFEIAALSATDVWAVGYYTNGTGGVPQTLTMHWNGSVWSVVTSPNSGAGENQLHDVVALSATDVWAVGHYISTTGGVPQTLIMRWNGSVWSVVSSPSPGTSGNRLLGVTAASPTDVWAVGRYNNGSAWRTLTMRWNGSVWSVVTSPNSGSGLNLLSAVTAISPNNLWAVGHYVSGFTLRTLIMQGNGTTWNIVPSPNSGSGLNVLVAVSGSSPTDVWAAGYYDNDTGRYTLLAHWDGGTWTIAPNSSSSGLYWGIGAGNTADVWAVGQYYDGTSNSTETLIKRSSGCRFPPPPPPGCNAQGNPIVTYAPKVWLRTNEVYGPEDALDFIGSSSLNWSNESPIPDEEIEPEGEIDPQILGRPPYTDVTRPRDPGNVYGGRNGYFLDLNDSETVRQGNRWNAPVYYDYAPCESVTYWFHYAYNDAPGARGWDHEGDWEGMRVYLNSNNLPYSIYYSQHDGGEYFFWHEVPKDPGTEHPVGWSAQGTHATYASAGKHLLLHVLKGYAPVYDWTDNGHEWNTWNWLRPVRMEPWYGFGGAWGEVGEHMHSTGPLGPGEHKRIGPQFGQQAGLRAFAEAPVTTPTRTPPSTRTPLATATVIPVCGLAWRVTSSANIGPGNNYLMKIAPASPNDIWAVGAYQAGGQSQTLTQHWNGSAWSIVPSPNVGSGDNQLQSVTSIASNDVWGVGFYLDGSTLRTLAQHWNGSTWTVAPSPNIGPGDNWLWDVEAVSANDVWAVGTQETSGVLRTLVLRWNGTAWSVISSPNIGEGNNTLSAIDAVSASDIWAVGAYENGTVEQTLVLHWDGSTWSVVSSPNVGTSHNSLGEIDAISANDVWAVGYRYEEGLAQTLVLHWDGSTWSVVSSPNVGSENNWLYQVAAVTDNEVWAIGYANVDGAARTLALKWNGSTWNVVSSANAEADESYLAGIVVVSAIDVWAVGYSRVNGVDQTLIQRYNEPCVSVSPTVPSPSVTTTSTPTATWTSTITSTPTVVASPTQACTISQDYVASTTAGATIVPGTTRVPGSICNSCSVSITLPFTYSFYGTPYSQVNVSNKGVVQFASNSSSGADTCLPNAGFNDSIFAYWDDLNTNINDSMGIFTSISGTAPNRIFNIEWRAGYVANDTRPRFEVRLYEGQPKFDVIYATTRRGFSATVGVQKGTGERFTQYACNTNNSVPNGTKLTFDQRVCAGVRPAKP